MTEITITTEFIKLQDLLKLANLVGTGGEAKIVVVRNLSHDALMRSAEELEQAIRGSQMMLSSVPSSDCFRSPAATSRTAPVSSSLRSCVHRQSRTQCMTCSTTVTV